MVLVNCMWRQDEIIKAIGDIEYKGSKAFKHVKTEGMRMYFEFIMTDNKIEVNKYTDMECKLVKSAITKIKGFDALAINIVPVINNNILDGYKYSIYGYDEAID